MVSQSALPRRPLGRTGLQASILGFGTAPLGDLFLELDDRTAIAAASRALELGINLLDTSPHYGNGLSEHRCGTALRRVKRQDVVLCTKTGRWMDPFHRPETRSGFVGGHPHRAVVDYSYDGTMRSVEQSLLRLGTDRIDLLLIHDVDVWTHGQDAIEDRFREAMAGAYVALDRLRSEGVVAGIGIGVNEAEMCVRFAQAGSFDVMLLAGRYSLLEQPALKEFMPLALKQGIAVLLGGVFNSGILATGAGRRREVQLSGRAAADPFQGGRDPAHLRRSWRSAADGGFAFCARSSCCRERGAGRRRARRRSSATWPH